MLRVIFLELLNRSLAAGWHVLIILLLRSLLRRFPRWVFCLMWGIVGLRLILPFLFESGLSLIPSTHTIEPSFDLGRMVVQTGIEQIDSSVNTYLDTQFDAAQIIPKVWYDSAMQVCSRIWLVGAVLLLGYGIYAELRLRHRVSASLSCGKNVFVCDDISSPFVLGVFKPRIYLPSAMGHAETECVLLHERAHIARRDPLWKVLGFALLCVYWFNPLVWIAYMCFSHDVELACDERVIRLMADDDKREYAQTLLRCSIRRKMLAISPVAFGEVGVKRRIKSIVWFKEWGDRTMYTAFILCMVLAVGFLTNPTVMASEYTSVSSSVYGNSVYYTAHFDCKGRHIEVGEYFHAQRGEIHRECEFYSYKPNTQSFHVHEYGTVMQIGICSVCGKPVYSEPLYEAYRCLSTRGGLEKIE